jgi:superfamily II DNA helicase RecQ
MPSFFTQLEVRVLSVIQWPMKHNETGGKSLTYQVPALCLEVRHMLYRQANIQMSVSQGLTLVISPLIALMKDQVDALCERGVKAANLDSTLTIDRSSFVKDEVLSGRLKILYVAPERQVVPVYFQACIAKPFLQA